MTKTKYIMSEGLAFAEQKDMEKLRRYAHKGWHVKSFAFMGYTLEQGAPTDVIYNVDYRVLDDDGNEYYDLFAAAGWTHVASNGNTHLFCASPHTKPIYSDRETTIEKYKNLAEPLHVVAIPLSAITLLAWVGATITTSTLQTILYIVSLIFTLLALPIVWTTIAAYRQQWRTQGKDSYVTISRLVPIVVLTSAIVALFVAEYNVVLIIAAAIIGAIVFPALLSMGLSVYYKVKRT